jgi:hypothetical protein
VQREAAGAPRRHVSPFAIRPPFEGSVSAVPASQRQQHEGLAAAGLQQLLQGGGGGGGGAAAAAASAGHTALQEEA